MSVAPVSSALMPTTRDTPWFAPFLSNLLCSHSQDLHRAAEVPPPLTQGLPTSPPPFKHLRAPLEVSNLPMPLISHLLPWCMRNCSLEQVCAAALLLYRKPPLFSAPAPVSCPRLCPPCHPEPSRALPSVLGPPTWPRSRLRRGFTAKSCGATTSS
jgi:hypothetical protein